MCPLGKASDPVIGAKDHHIGETRPRGMGRARRCSVIALGTILVVGACSILSAALAQSTWGHANLGDRPLNEKTRETIRTVQGQLKDQGIAPQAVTWLDAALDPQTHPSAARLYLLLAQDALEPTTDAGQIEAATRLRTIAQMIRSDFDAERPPRWSTPIPGSARQG